MSRPVPVRPAGQKLDLRTIARRVVKKPVRLARGVLTMPVIAAHAAGLRPTDDLRLPVFMGIGGVRSGSTWLHHNLAAHPDLFLPATKELHFFNGRMHLGLEHYTRQFADAGDAMCGEVTPSYGVIAPWRIKVIHRLMPDLRLVLIVRNPIDRAWSHALMKTAREHDRHPSDVDDAEFVAQFRSRFSIERGEFSKIIERWTSVFGEEQLHIAFFDDIVQRPQGMLIEVLNHIGARTDIDWQQVPFQQVIDRGVRGEHDVIGSSTTELPDHHRRLLAELYATEIATLADTLGGPAKRWLDAL